MPPPFSRKHARAYHHGNLRNALVQATLEQAELSGPESVSIKELAQKLKVSQPAPYRHFSDRDELLATAAGEALRQFNEILRKAAEESTGRTKLSSVVHAVLDFGRNRSGVYRLMFASRILPRSQRGCELRIAAAETFSILSESLECSGGKVPRERAAWAMWALVHGAMMLAEEELPTHRIGRQGIEEMVEDAVRHFELMLFPTPPRE